MTIDTPIHVCPLAPLLVTLYDKDRGEIRVTHYGETTPVPELFITPNMTWDGHFAYGHVLVHGPTGRCVTSGGDLDRLRAIACDLAEFDWSDVTDPTLLQGAVEVLRKHQFTDPSAAELPAHDAWGPDGKGEGLKRAAVPMATDILADLQKALSKTGGEDAVPLDVPDPDSPKGTKPNIEWTFWVFRMVHDFGLAYLLLILNALDAEAADSAAAWLADQWASGESLGEWAWEWHQALRTGGDIELPGVPVVGELLRP